MQSRTRTTRLYRMFAAFAAAVLAISGFIAVTSTPAHASTGGYPWWDAPCRYSNGGTSCSNGTSMYDWYMDEDTTPGYNTAGENWDQWGYQYRNCTSFVAWKLSSLGVPADKISNLHHGGQWHEYAPAKGLTVGTTPAIGAAAIKPATYNNDGSLATFGHVAYVNGYNSTTGEISVEEYNRSSNGTYSTWTGQPSSRGFTKFVYFGDLMTNPPSGSGNTQQPLLSNVSTIAGNWSGDNSQDFMYITPRSDGGSDFAVWESTPTGIAWRGSWASASNIGFSIAQFIPNDLDGDGLLDLLYVTPRSGGGFDLSLFHNTGTNFSWNGILWSPTNLNMSAIKFLPGNWTGDSKGDLAYVTPKSGGGFDLAVLESTGTGLNWHGLWWSEPNLAYNTTRFVPVDTDGDGLLDILYSTPRPGTIGFDMSQVRNTGSGVSWVRLEWGEPNLDYSKIRFIPGYWASTTRQGIAYVTPKSGGGFDVSVMNMTANGMAWAGLWWSQSTLAFDTTPFIPADNNGDGDTDLFYASPRSGGGFDLALNQNANNTFMFVGQQWNPTNLSLTSTKFLPQF